MYIKSEELKNILSKYIERITEFYSYSLDDSISLRDSLRHIEIIRTQISSDISLISMNEMESEFIHSILSDSYYFEKNKPNDLDWKINFLRVSWKRLLDDLGIDTSNLVVNTIKNSYVDVNSKTNGRYIYQKYNG